MTVAAFALILAVWGSTPAQARQTSPTIVEPSVREAIASSSEGEAYVLVVFDRDDLGEGTARELKIEERRHAILADLSESDFRPVYQWQHVAGMSGYASERGLEVLRRHRFVERIGSDMEGSGQLGTSVPFIGGTQAHALGVTGEGVTIAVIDSGVDTDHPDLIGDIAIGGKHFLMQGSDVGMQIEDTVGHGTSVAGTITSDGVVAAVGIAPDAMILPVRVIGSSGQSFLSDWVAAVDYVVTVAPALPHLAAINMSLASSITFSESPCDSTAAVNLLLGDAISNARKQGILTFASSGNRGECGSMGSPACLEAAIAVAAVYEADNGREPIVSTYQNFFGGSFGACADLTTQADQVTCFSNRSDSNELAAPGRSLICPTVGGGVGEWTGTSQASPLAAGVLALLVEGLDPDVETCLTAIKLHGSATSGTCGAGPNPIRVNAAAALAAGKPFEYFCFGDGGNQMGCSDCPCGNNAVIGERGGCTNSVGGSARLHASGVPRVSTDSLHLVASELPNGSATLLISGANRLPANPASPCFAFASGIANIGNGLRCTGGSLKRHGIRFSDSGGFIGDSNAGWGGNDAPAAGLIAQGGFAAGQTRHFQAFYRDNPHATCTNGLGTTQAVSTTFAP